MIEDQNLPTERLAKQLSAIQQQLQELTKRFDNVDNRLEELSDVPAKIAKLEDDLMLIGDRLDFSV